MMISPCKPCMPGLMASPKGKAPQFAGHAERQQFKARLDGFSDESIARLAEIKRAEAAERPKHHLHVLLAIAHGKVDPNIKWINDQIQSLLKSRNGKKDSDPAASALAKEHLGDLRATMDESLGEHGFDQDGKPLSQAERLV